MLTYVIIMMENLSYSLNAVERESHEAGKRGAVTAESTRT